MISTEARIRLAEARLARAAHSSCAEYWAAVRSLDAIMREAGR